MSTRDETPHEGPGGPAGQGQIPPERDAEDLAALIAEAEQLDGMVARLHAERAPLASADDTSDLAVLLPTAALLRSSAPGASEPRPAFVEGLRARLVAGEGGVPPTGHAVERRTRDVSRRGFLRRGAVAAAAAAAAGLAAGVAIERQVEGGADGTSSAPWRTPLVTAGQWVSVALVDAIPVGGVRRFATDTLVGYLRRTTEGYTALSAACTHMGCLVAWNASARSFDCPCHGGRFSEDGASYPASPVAYRPLPRIQTKVESGQVWVFVPRESRETPADPTEPGSTGQSYG